LTGINLSHYREVFKGHSFRRFWVGYTVSILGDSMTRVALTWFVFEETGSAEALGLLTVAYTAPVFIGGLLAGVILDRFDRRLVMTLDNLLRGVVVLLVPILFALDSLSLWYVYIVAAVYGLLMMVPLAGGPSIVPSLVQEQHLDTANALETLSFTLSNVVGPPIAGFLIAQVGAPNVLILDALSYFLFAAVLLRIRIPPQGDPHGTLTSGGSSGLRAAARLLLGDSVLLSTTLMFMAFNIGLGAMLVWLPIYSDQIGNGGSEIYGLLLGFLAVGEVASSFLAGGFTAPWPVGSLIAGAQLLAGASLGLLLLGPDFLWIIPGLFLLGFFSAPLTIWAQTLRMQIIPDHLRGRTFALLRTLMQGAIPIGGAAAGFLVPALGISGVIALSCAVTGLPGIVGFRIKSLRTAGK
jgi:MFS family permease